MNVVDAIIEEANSMVDPEEVDSDLVDCLKSDVVSSHFVWSIILVGRF